MKPSKCLFFSKSLDILGHQITPEGRRPSQKGTEAISKLSIPKTVTHVKRFLGLVGYFRDYIKNMSNRTVHLRNLLKKGTKFVWSSEHQKEFDDIKSVILSPNVILYHPDWSKPFQVETDASRFGIGLVLTQENNGSIRPVRFASRAFNNTESRWETMHQELYAVKWRLEQFRPYVLGKRTKVITDHANLSFLHSVRPQQSKLAPLCLQMAEFVFFIEHKPGVKNIVPDYLSRYPVSDEGDNLVIPPPDVITFITSAYSLDVCDCTPDTVTSTFYAPNVCLNLICSPISPVVTNKNPTLYFDQNKLEPVIQTNSTNLQNNSPTQIKTIDQLELLSPPKSPTIVTCQWKPLNYHLPNLRNYNKKILY